MICLRDYLMGLVKEKKCHQISCPSCSADLDTMLIRQSLSPAEFDRYLEAAMTSYLDADDVMIHCPSEKCNAIMEVVKLQDLQVPANYTEQDDQGKILSPE